jgi:4'-phosphopantetheinyl transferase EntD
MNQLTRMFPSTVSCVFSARPPESFALLGEEINAAATMSPSRQREFSHGRMCARQALAALGLPDCTVPTEPSRAPRWPDKIAGSISHCGDYAAAVAARTADCPGLGIDLEKDTAIDSALSGIICRTEEYQLIQSIGQYPTATKLIFSAKESIFKCIWPSVQRFVDFQEIEIQPDLLAGTFRAIAHSPALPHELIESIRGHFVRTDGLLITAAYRI